MAIYKRYRICRRHFDSEAMNGGCRRLLKTAVPTLHLNRNCRDDDDDDTDDSQEPLLINEALEERDLLLPKGEPDYQSTTTELNICEDSLTRTKCDKSNICECFH